MVRVQINVKRHALIINGHAGAAEPGRDLVCCAVSTLAETLSRYLETRMEDGALEMLMDKVEPGNVQIIAWPESTNEKQIRALFEMIREGYRAIAEEYPQYIKLRED